MRLTSHICIIIFAVVAAVNPVRGQVDSGLESKIVYGARDTQLYNHKHNQMHLYGEAFVEYEDKRLEADYIILDLARNFADARMVADMEGSRKPLFKDAGKEYNYNRLKYDFKNEKGVVYEALSREGEFIIHGERTKYVGEKSNVFGDEAAVYNANSVITTCDHDEPHFGIRAGRLKVIPEKVAVIGPSNLELAGIPTPVILPFGFYPLVEGRSSGFIFPSDYEFNSRNKGFGLRGFGWYFPINDYVHVRLTADVYTRGSFALYANSQYRKKYKYNGSAYLAYDRTLTEDIESAATLVQQGFSVRLNHQQEPKAHPFINVGGSLNIVSNNNQQRVFNDAQSVLTNTYNSNFYFRHNLPGSPFNLNVGLNHNQNTNTGRVNITFPDASLNMNTIFPFERKNKGTNEDLWYERISFDYDMALKSFVATTDSTLFTQEMYDDIKTGINHRINTGLSTRVMRYFNLVPRADYEETWVLNTIDKSIPADSVPVKSNIVETNEFGFARYQEFSAGVSLNTQIFGTKTFEKGWLRGIRHTMKPDIGFAYAPDTRSRYVDSLLLEDGRIEEFTRFEGGPFGSPSFSNLRSQFTWRLNNILELKYFSRKDSTEKKFKLFDNLTMNGNYNFASDSLKWSTVTMSSTSRFFNGITTLQTNWTFDPYIELDGRTVDKTVWEARGKLVRLERGSMRLSNRMSVKQLRALFARPGDAPDAGDRETPADRGDPRDLPTGPGDERFELQPEDEDPARRLISLMELFNNININHELRYEILSADDVREGRVTTHTISFTGTLPLTDNWSVSIGNLGYDFVRKGLSYTAVSFSRRLHCWDMRFSWYPNRDTYSFFIGVSSSNLSFIKYNYGQNNVDGLFGPRRF